MGTWSSVSGAWRWLGVLLTCLVLGQAVVARAAGKGSAGKKIVFIAGVKSHGPGDHEYEKGCRLLARSLETASNLKGYRTEVHLYGWPEDPHALDDADAIVVYCDGSDHREADHPLLAGDRLETLRRQMKRGAGLVLLHYTLFVPNERGGPELLDWVGGYFDYQSGPAPQHWYSRIQNASTTPVPASPKHPISRGLSPFPLREEYYYRLRFRQPDSRRVPILQTTLPNEKEPETVAWAVQRKDGGRGFAYSGGHYHANWQVEGLRRMALNAIVWCAGGVVPEGGVQSTVPSDIDNIRALLVTGHHHPAHDWRTTTPAIRDALAEDPRMKLTVIEDPERLATEDLARYDLIIQNYCNWQTPTLGVAARERLLHFVRGGGGLLLVHFANGAWLDWPEYRQLCRRVWIDGISGHDPYGPFRVNIPHPDHLLTTGIAPFDTTDELYFRQQGDMSLEPLLTARSKVTGKEEPLAFTYTEGRGRVFQSLLGHDARALRTPGVAEVLRRATAWVAQREVLPRQVAATAAGSPAKITAGRFGMALDARGGGTVTAAGRAEYQNPPLTVECWAKLAGKSSFNVLVANSAKESPRHWELYTTTGTGTLAAYLPGLSPSVLDSTTDVCDNQWHHLAMTYLPGRIRLLVDGRVVLDREVAFTNAAPAVGPLWFGGYPPGGIGCDGLVDEVRISRTIREITAVPTEPLRLDEETLGLWRFDALENGRFGDLSSAANGAVGEVAPPPPAPVSLPAPPGPLPKINRRTSVDWPFVGNDPGGMRYSRLSQIHRGNVRDLKVAWTYHTGDAAGTTIECTPIVVDGVMYLTTAKVQIAALDAATGREIWRFNPRTGGVNRGVAYWSDGKPGGARRILSALNDGRLFSLDAATGRPDPRFGKSGVVDLRAGIERDISQQNYGSTSPPAIFEDRVIIPIVNSEGQPGAPGDIRAFDVRTGREVWRFHTIPQPHEFGNDTWEGDSWKERSGANPWSGFTVDVKRGLVFCGTGSAASDFYGGDRPGQNLFANCTLALDARTGKRVWHFQTLHHDIWDHDLPCPPVLATMRRGGKTRELVAQPTKTGHLFVFDRKTGQPVFPVEERPVPPSEVPGERAWPTQPIPVKPPPFSRQSVTEADLTGIFPEAAANARELFAKLGGGATFQPPSRKGTIVVPGFHGGANWSGASFDPTNGRLYINTNNVPNVTTLVPQADGFNHTGYFRFQGLGDYPSIKPPWGNLTAVDLTKGEFAWQVTLGEYPELTKRGVPQTGTENFGGTIVTAGGLVFIGGTKDERFHAFDKETGELLWQTQLPAGGYATPCTYMVNGRQYVVIAAGGGGKLGTRSGDAFVAFALPKQDTVARR